MYPSLYFTNQHTIYKYNPAFLNTDINLYNDLCSHTSLTLNTTSLVTQQSKGTVKGKTSFAVNKLTVSAYNV